MPLKLADTTAPASTTILNKWADDQEHSISGLQSTITKLQAQINTATAQKTAAATATPSVTNTTITGSFPQGNGTGTGDSTAFTDGSLPCQVVHISATGGPSPSWTGSGSATATFAHTLGRIPTVYIPANGTSLSLVTANYSSPWTTTSMSFHTTNGSIPATFLIF